MTDEERMQLHHSAIEILRQEVAEIEAVMQRNQDTAVQAGQADEAAGLLGDYGIIGEALRALRQQKVDAKRRSEVELNRLADISAGRNPGRDDLDELHHPGLFRDEIEDQDPVLELPRSDDSTGEPYPGHWRP